MDNNGLKRLLAESCGALTKHAIAVLTKGDRELAEGNGHITNIKAMDKIDQSEKNTNFVPKN